MIATTIPTPAVLRIQGVEHDAGLEVVHDLTGAEDHLLHSIAVKASDRATVKAVEAFCYHTQGGFTSPRGTRYHVYTKSFPLSARNLS